MTDPLDGEKLVNSAALTVIARFAMIVAAAALPIGGWMLQEVSRKIDNARDLAIETSFNVKLLQQAAQLQTSMLNDHETRVRVLESKTVVQK